MVRLVRIQPGLPAGSRWRRQPHGDLARIPYDQPCRLHGWILLPDRGLAEIQETLLVIDIERGTGRLGGYHRRMRPCISRRSRLDRSDLRYGHDLRRRFYRSYIKDRRSGRRLLRTRRLRMLGYDPHRIVRYRRGLALLR